MACATPPAAKPNEATVMAYNVLYAAASVDLIADEDPDVLCLTELRPPFLRAFDKRLRRRYPHRCPW